MKYERRERKQTHLNRIAMPFADAECYTNTPYTVAEVIHWLPVLTILFRVCSNSSPILLTFTVVYLRVALLLLLHLPHLLHTSTSPAHPKQCNIYKLQSTNSRVRTISTRSIPSGNLSVLPAMDAKQRDMCITKYTFT